MEIGKRCGQSVIAKKNNFIKVILKRAGVVMLRLNLISEEKR